MKPLLDFIQSSLENSNPAVKKAALKLLTLTLTLTLNLTLTLTLIGRPPSSSSSN